MSDIHKFWARFPSRFPQPLSQNLRNLVLYSDLPLGWFPTLDLRTVKFLNLHSLTLGHHIFHHHQVDWILSHGATLEELNLDRCSILYQIGHSIPGWLDSEGYPVAQPPGHNICDYGWSSAPDDLDDAPEFTRTLQFRSNALRWHDIFSCFASSLPKLQTFRFGASKQWNFHVESRYADRGLAGSPGHPIMPWEDEQNIRNELLEERYLIWDDWEMKYRPHWTTEDNEYEKEDWSTEWTARFETYPKCEEEDKRSLQALITTLGSR